MKNKITTLFLYGSALLVQLSFSAIAQQEFSRTYPGIDQLEMEVGAIEISYTGSPTATEVTLKAFLGEIENADKDLIIVTIDNILKIAYKPPVNRNNWKTNHKRYIQLLGPEAMVLSINNTSGKVSVTGITAEKTDLSISSGNILASNIQGNIRAKGSSGKMELNNINGSVTCSITSGNVSISNVQGDLDFSSTSGILKANDVKGRVNAELTSGTMRLDHIGELGKLGVTSGSIKANNAGLGSGTSLNGSSGSIQITTPTKLETFNYDLKAGSGSLRVGNTSKTKNLSIMNGANSTIVGNISSGSIQIKNL